jgi:hypothetical protein
MLLQLRLEEGEVDEDEFVEQEAYLLQRLREIKELKKARAQEAFAALAEQEAPEFGRRRVIVETAFDDEER